MIQQFYDLSNQQRLNNILVIYMPHSATYSTIIDITTYVFISISLHLHSYDDSFMWIYYYLEPPTRKPYIFNWREWIQEKPG